LHHSWRRNSVDRELDLYAIGRKTHLGLGERPCGLRGQAVSAEWKGGLYRRDLGVGKTSRLGYTALQGSPYSPSSPAILSLSRVYTIFMRIFSLLFAAIALVMLGVFVIYVVRGPVDPVIAAGIFVSFLACLAPALLLLKPFEPPEELQRRREEFRREREERRRSNDDPPRGEGS
jgi:hypothetical protein